MREHSDADRSPPTPAAHWQAPQFPAPCTPSVALPAHPTPPSLQGHPLPWPPVGPRPEADPPSLCSHSVPLLDTTRWLPGALITYVLICPLQDGDGQPTAGEGRGGVGGADWGYGSPVRTHPVAGIGK